MEPIRLNNPIPLHFYSPEERLPDDNQFKIVIYRKESGDYPQLAKYFPNVNQWYGVDDPARVCGLPVIAWASFSPEWVLGVDL